MHIISFSKIEKEPDRIKSAKLIEFELDTLNYLEVVDPNGKIKIDFGSEERSSVVFTIAGAKLMLKMKRDSL